LQSEDDEVVDYQCCNTQFHTFRRLAGPPHPAQFSSTRPGTASGCFGIPDLSTSLQAELTAGGRLTSSMLGHPQQVSGLAVHPVKAFKINHATDWQKSFKIITRFSGISVNLF
jgi:hypothetical protein